MIRQGDSAVPRAITIALFALSLVLMVVVGWVGAAQSNPGGFVGYLMTAGTISVALGAAGLAWVRSGRAPLWLQMTVTYALGIGLALANVLLTAQMMFITKSDLPILVLLLLFAGAASLALGSALAGTLARRVAALCSAALALADGRLDTRVAVRGRDELATLGREFNSMAERLAAAADERERQERARRDLIAAVSHDLRTPLASIRAMVEAMSDGLVDDEPMRARYLATMKTQIGTLSAQIDDLFELSRMDSGALDLDRQPVIIGDLVSDLIEGMRAQSQARGVALSGSADADLPPLALDAQKFERALANLVSNAIRHTPAGGAVDVTVCHSDRQVLVAVRDTGEGIAAADLPRIFERFYRGEQSRSRATGGAGLGLAITRGIIEAHGGGVSASSVRGHGTTMTIALPLD